MKITKLILILSVFAVLQGCKKGPEIIEAQSSSEIKDDSKSTGIFNPDQRSENSSAETSVQNVHNVKVLEVLPTTKYVYLKVQEGGKDFWIATGKKDITVGQNYFYKEGILKTNFESKEYDRVFEEVYLVANLVSSGHGNNQENTISDSKEVASKEKIKIEEVEGSIKISELVENMEKYKGKQVQLTGICTKLNANIMGRNWIHLQDGSMDQYDLVVTSDIPVPEGHRITIKGVVALDKDFGAGYLYDLIIENGQVVSSK